MHKGVIYFVLGLFAVYFSFITGKILADIDSAGDINGQVEVPHILYYSSNPNEGNNFFDYLNPFAGFDLTGDISSENYYDFSGSEVLQTNNHNSGSGNSFRGFTSKGSGRNEVGGVLSPGGETHMISSSAKKSSDPGGEHLLGVTYNNPFGGLISQLAQVNRHQLAQGPQVNPTGTFGLKLGLPNNDHVLAPLPPEEAPLDSGVYGLLGLCILTAVYFICRNAGFYQAF